VDIPMADIPISNIPIAGIFRKPFFFTLDLRVPFAGMT
jgi:hypothetical protein